MNDANECKYRPGQVWDYKTRPSEPLSTLTILKVWTTRLDKTVVHIAIDDVHITDLTGEEIAHCISHVPIFQEALDRSVTKLVKESGPIPDFAEAYADWEAGVGAICIKTAAEIVTLTEDTCRYGTEEPEQEGDD
jgi:hypothetical protein